MKWQKNESKDEDESTFNMLIELHETWLTFSLLSCAVMWMEKFVATHTQKNQKRHMIELNQHSILVLDKDVIFLHHAQILPTE